MLSKHLESNVVFSKRVSSWEEAIKVASEPLLNKDFINQSYVRDMIENVHKYGPYIVIMPGVAMPHARNEGGVIKTGISFLKLDTPVLFPEEKEVGIVIVLAAEDSSGHMDLLSDLSSLLIEEDIKYKLENAQSEEEIINLIKMVE
ncbi:hypothetical protein GCM10011351_15660 [Paraliobacillus quinghaiensis]|uniref:Ascorbate-specific PTS system EIIA component n=1 Tax=Paraliobacillus quinghaiensis TaxID=470815 RepID=A0A917TNW5_9BACI|nr:PTS sugar transporter subunit IIA [Paraliobacillus quinghaiensis]GGM30378.1 hypothetical protein GCM10011351_15660 [Paraliobacillus quinghaiensis]